MRNYQLNTFQYVFGLFLFVISLKIHGLYAQSSVEEGSLAAKKCWIGLNTDKLFEDLDTLDSSYNDIRSNYEKSVGLKNFDSEMLAAMLESRGVAKRLPYRQHEFIHNRIPAGLNLGGHCLVAFNHSMLLFQRMKLRNETRFRVNYVQSSLMDMTLSAHLSLHDLHLHGSYQRVYLDSDPSNLFYRPTYGRAEILLKDVQYKMEGRYRLLRDRLTIEHIISNLVVPEILMTYSKNSTCSDYINIPVILMAEFLQRMNNDLDKWLKDYFNDYLVELGLGSHLDNQKFLKYDIKKAKILNEFVDNSLNRLKKRMYQLKALAVKASDFTIFAINGMEIRLRNGVVRGLDSMHRVSVATTRKQDNVRFVDAVIGFGILKLVYRYEVLTGSDMPPLQGLFILTSDELIARLDMELIKEPDSGNVHLDFMEHLKPETLTVEGSLNRILGRVKEIVENHILALMSNVLYHRIRLIATLTKCDPDLPVYLDPGEVYPEDKKASNTGGQIVENSETYPDNTGKNFGYGVKKEHSIELELPAEGKQPAKTIKINYVQNLTMHEIKENEDPDVQAAKNDETELENKEPEIKESPKVKDNEPEKKPEKSDEHIDLSVSTTTQYQNPPSVNENKPEQSQLVGDIGVERQDSVEIEIQGKGNKPGQKKKLVVKQQFSLKDLDGSDTKVKGETKMKPDSDKENNVDNVDIEFEEKKLKNMKYDFGVQRQDSADVKLIPEGEENLKNMRINYKEDFSLKEV